MDNSYIATLTLYGSNSQESSGSEDQNEDGDDIYWLAKLYCNYYVHLKVLSAGHNNWITQINGFIALLSVAIIRIYNHYEHKSLCISMLKSNSSLNRNPLKYRMALRIRHYLYASVFAINWTAK